MAAYAAPNFFKGARKGLGDSMKALIVFDSKHGTTEEAAQSIAAAVKEAGHAADLLDLRKKGAAAVALSGYDAVALGGPFYAGRWSRRARAFAAARRADLSGLPFGLFAIGSNPDLGDKAARSTLPPSLASAVSASAYFGGRLDFERLGRLERFIVEKVAGTTESSSTLDLGQANGFAAALIGAA